MLATLLLSVGVPMLLAGDEAGRSQNGNNNAYCQDNDIGWIDWSLLDSEEGRALQDFVRALIRLRNDHMVFRRRHFFHGRVIPGTAIKDIVWLTPEGRENGDEDWQAPHARFLSYVVSGQAGTSTIRLPASWNRTIAFSSSSTPTTKRSIIYCRTCFASRTMGAACRYRERVRPRRRGLLRGGFCLLGRAAILRIVLPPPRRKPGTIEPRSMSQPSLLDELAAQAGIEPYYHDIWGARHALSIDTKRAFLDAMGMSAATEEQIAQSLAALATKPWRRALEPVTVLYEGRNERAASVVFAGRARLVPRPGESPTEDGTQYEGNISLGDLPVAEAKTVDGRHLERRLLALPGSLPLGYHRLEVMGDALPGGSGVATLIVAPQQAYLPDKLQRSPGTWGFSLQLYGLQGRESWGLGDFGDLSGFAAKVAGLGAGALGLNPLHALFPGNPAHVSPYSPSSRCFLNPLYIDIEAVPDLSRMPDGEGADP